MTEKRFNDAKGYVYDGKKCIGIINDDFTCENIINLLNTFNDENEQLKKELDKLKVVNEMLSIDFSNSEHELLRENEQLKKELESFKPIIFESDGKPVTLYKKGDVE